MERSTLVGQALFFVLMSVLGFLCYSNSFDVPFQYDDFGFGIKKNSPFAGMVTVASLWEKYPARFLGLLSFSVDIRLFGDHTRGYHVVNFIIHLLMGGVLFVFIQKLNQVKKVPEALGLYVAAFASLLYVCHPLNTQAVTYLVQRFTSLASLCFLGSLLCYVNYRIKRSHYWFAGSVLLALLANVTKETGATVAVVWLMLDWCFFQLPRPELKRSFMVWAVGVTGVLLFPFLLFFFGNSVSLSDVQLTENEFTSFTYFLTQFKVILLYLKLFFVPLGQSVFHDIPVVSSVLELEFFFAFLIHGGLVLIGLLSRKNHPLITFGILFYYVAISPDSSVVPLPHEAFEHRTYLGNAGLLMAVGGLITLLGGVPSIKARVRPMLAQSVAVSIVLVFGLLTFNRNDVWGSVETLWTEALNLYPEHSTPNVLLGNHYAKRKDFEKAAPYFVRASQYDPDNPVHYGNIGISFVQIGQHKRALEAFEEALRLEAENPRRYRDLGAMLMKMGQLDSAERVLQKCITDLEKSRLCELRLQKLKKKMKRAAGGAAVRPEGEPGNERTVQ